MKHSELRKPLIQSAIVLLVIIFLISFVAGSEAHGFIGGITSIFKGFFLTILYGIALTFALIISIAILIGIFFGAVALYSPDTSREMFSKFRRNLSDLIASWCRCCKEDSSCSSEQVCDPVTVESPKPLDESPAPDKQDDVQDEEDTRQDELELLRETVKTELAEISRAIELNQEQNTALSTSLDELKETIAAQPVNELTSRTNNLETQQEKIGGSLSTIANKFDKLEDILTKHTQTSNNYGERLDALQNQLTAVSDELQTLKSAKEESVQEEPIKNKVENPDVPGKIVHRIFSYIEKDKDKSQFASIISEAVTGNMTYAQIDDVLSKSLPKKIDSIIKEHPSLTKQYIRDCKKAKQ